MSGLKEKKRLLNAAGRPVPAEVRQLRRRHEGGASAWRKNATYSVNLAGRREAGAIQIAPIGAAI
jgi:hypothetical protein